MSSSKPSREANASRTMVWSSASRTRIKPKRGGGPELDHPFPRLRMPEHVGGALAHRPGQDRVGLLGQLARALIPADADARALKHLTRPRQLPGEGGLAVPRERLAHIVEGAAGDLFGV